MYIIWFALFLKKLMNYMSMDLMWFNSDTDMTAKINQSLLCK